MGKKILLTFFFVFLLISSISSVIAWMPPTHTYIDEKTILQAPNSAVGKVVKDNMEDYVGCTILADISVFYYFENGINSIGKTYKATHTTSLCQRAVSMATNDRQLACAYGLCSHEVEDSISHNEFVPEVIGRTNMVNGLIHIFAEEKVNDELLSAEGKDLDTRTKQALSDVAPIHKEFLRKVLVQQGSDFPFDNMYDAFVNEVTGQDKFSVGFRGFTAVPYSIHAILLLYFIFGMITLAYIIRTEKKNLFNKISMFLLLILVVIPVILAYVLFFTGNLWQFFQFASNPISSLMPTSGWQNHVSKAISENVNFFNNGASYVNSIKDPSGEQSLASASSKGGTVRIIIDIILILLTTLFIYLNIRKNKK